MGFVAKRSQLFNYTQGNIMTYPKKTGPNSWTIQVRENGKTKELFIELPPEALAQVGWDIGDDLIWEELDDQVWSLKKKDDTTN